MIISEAELVEKIRPLYENQTYCGSCGRRMERVERRRGKELEIWWQCPRWVTLLSFLLDETHDARYLGSLDEPIYDTKTGRKR